jgi:hypothetical protein
MKDLGAGHREVPGRSLKRRAARAVEARWPSLFPLKLALLFFWARVVLDRAGDKRRERAEGFRPLAALVEVRARRTTR